MIASNLLSLSIWVPIVGAMVVLATGSDRNAGLARIIALLAALAGFLVTIPLYLNFDNTKSAMQFVEQAVVDSVQGLDFDSLGPNDVVC